MKSVNESLHILNEIEKSTVELQTQFTMFHDNTLEYYNNVLSNFNPITEIFPVTFEKENKFDKFNCGKLYS